MLSDQSRMADFAAKNKSTGLNSANTRVKRPVGRTRQYYNTRRIAVGGPQVRLNE